MSGAKCVLAVICVVQEAAGSEERVSSGLSSQLAFTDLDLFESCRCNDIAGTRECQAAHMSAEAGEVEALVLHSIFLAAA